MDGWTFWNDFFDTMEGNSRRPGRGLAFAESPRPWKWDRQDPLGLRRPLAFYSRIHGDPGEGLKVYLEDAFPETWQMLIDHVFPHLGKLGIMSAGHTDDGRMADPGVDAMSSSGVVENSFTTRNRAQNRVSTSPTEKESTLMSRKHQTVAEYLSDAVRLSGKSNKEVAEEAGFARPNIISMLKSGVTQVPIARARALAEAVGVDPADFLVRCLKEYQPETWTAIEELLLEDRKKQ